MMDTVSVKITRVCIEETARFTEAQYEFLQTWV